MKQMPLAFLVAVASRLAVPRCVSVAWPAVGLEPHTAHRNGTGA
jgi:hypothetical protein